VLPWASAGRARPVGGSERTVVFDEERRESLLELEAERVGEHAEEDVRAYAVVEPMVDRADLELGALHPAEGLLGVSEQLVRADDRVRGERIGADAGAENVEAVRAASSLIACSSGP
jgi:hypothetical protein